MITHLATCSSNKFTDLNPWQNLQRLLTWLPVPVTNLQTSVPGKTLNDHSPGYLYQWQIYNRLQSLDDGRPQKLSLEQAARWEAAEAGFLCCVWSRYASRNSNNNKMWSLCLQTAKIKWSHYASRHGNKTKPNDNKNSMTTTHLATCSSGKFRFPFFLYTPSMVRASMWNRWKRPWLPEGAPDACDHIICSMVRSVCWNPSHDSWSWWSRWRDRQWSL